MIFTSIPIRFPSDTELHNHQALRMSTGKARRAGTNVPLYT